MSKHVGFSTEDEEINEDGRPSFTPGDAASTEVATMPAANTDDNAECSRGLVWPADDDPPVAPEHAAASTGGRRRVSFQDDFTRNTEPGNTVDGRGDTEEVDVASSSTMLPPTPGRKVHFNNESAHRSVHMFPETVGDAHERHRAAGPAVVTNFNKDSSPEISQQRRRKSAESKQPSSPKETASASGTPTRVYRKVRSGRFANLKVTLEEPTPNEGMTRSQTEMPSNPGGTLEKLDLRMAAKVRQAAQATCACMYNDEEYTLSIVSMYPQGPHALSSYMGIVMMLE